MITNCILTYVLVFNNFGSTNVETIFDLTTCDNYVPESTYKYVEATCKFTRK